MNKNLQEGIALAKELTEVVKNPNCEVIIGTPFIHLASVAEVIKDSCIKLSAENCANHASGAYTGEVSAEMVKSTGAEYVILGHSERREYYNETPEILKEKVQLALANGLKVIFCTVSPSSIVCRRSTPCVEGCCGPRFTTNASSSNSGTSFSVKLPSASNSYCMV